MSSNNNSRGSDNNDNNIHTIGSKDLLQTNATIIAGVLILLTIATSSQRIFTLTEVIIVIIATLPFISSCDILLTRYKSNEYRFRAARITTGVGLIGLIMAITYFLSANVHR